VRPEVTSGPSRIPDTPCAVGLLIGHLGAVGLVQAKSPPSSFPSLSADTVYCVRTAANEPKSSTGTNDVVGRARRCHGVRYSCGAMPTDTLPFLSFGSGGLAVLGMLSNVVPVVIIQVQAHATAQPRGREDIGWRHSSGKPHPSSDHRMSDGAGVPRGFGEAEGMCIYLLGLAQRPLPFQGRPHTNNLLRPALSWELAVTGLVKTPLRPLLPPPKVGRSYSRMVIQTAFISRGPAVRGQCLFWNRDTVLPSVRRRPN